MPSASWLIVRNVATEGPGILADVLSEVGLAHRTIDAFGTDSVPDDARDLAGLVILGGPMGVYDAPRYPSLSVQQRLIASALAAGVPTLGICLGAQLLAATAGARVFPGPRKEIGWAPLHLTESGAADAVLAPLVDAPAVFHLHGDTFDLPAGAVHLARSAVYPMQAFRVGPRAYGLQFHLEFTAETIDAVLDDPACRRDLAEAHMSPSSIRAETPDRIAALEPAARRVFESFVQLARAPAG